MTRIGRVCASGRRVKGCAAWFHPSRTAALRLRGSSDRGSVRFVAGASAAGAAGAGVAVAGLSRGAERAERSDRRVGAEPARDGLGEVMSWRARLAAAPYDALSARSVARRPPGGALRSRTPRLGCRIGGDGSAECGRRFRVGVD